jgi:hypothetical protein
LPVPPAARIALLVLLAPLLCAAPAHAETQTATSGAVTAAFSFDRVDDWEFTNFHLTVTRAGVAAYDGPIRVNGCEDPYCHPGGGDQRDSVRAGDLDGNGDPEVLVDFFTGGAHCCYASVLLWWDGTAYRAIERNWGDPGYRVSNADGRGTPELVTADPRFAYAFSAFAFSGFPVRILRFRDGRLINVTHQMRRVVRADARRWMRAYRRMPRSYEPQGVLAAWAADRYLLGHRRSALRFVRRAVRSGKLRSMPRGRAFPRRLDRKLRRWGY